MCNREQTKEEVITALTAENIRLRKAASELISGLERLAALAKLFAQWKRNPFYFDIDEHGDMVIRHITIL